LSGQWPLTKNWYGVGRISYSLQDKRILESLIGLEYNGGCWVFRMGAQRFVTSANQVSTPVFFQLELNGLSKLGVGNGLDALTKTIPGYQKLNPGDFQ
jgi:LPS-assembly protein